MRTVKGAWRRFRTKHTNFIASMVSGMIVRQFSLLSRSRVLPARIHFPEGPGTVSPLTMKKYRCAIYRNMLFFLEYAIPNQKQRPTISPHGGGFSIWILLASPRNVVPDTKEVHCINSFK